MERKLERHLPHREGFFVEAGANDGFNQSNTYWFERFRGWHGLLVEPVPALAERCRRARPESEVVNSALVAPDFHGESLTMSYGNLTSHVKASRGTPEEEIAHLARGAGLDEMYEVRVPARTLTSILEDAWAPTIDLLSLDVEGYELEVLRGLDFERFAPRFVLVEVLVERGADRGPVDRLLAERYDWVEDLSHHDSLYRLRDG
jgi:FkbM family methyltransferase